MEVTEGERKMRILMIRHGDPDYERDCLTETGRQEAALLAGIVGSLQPGDCYVSPLGRARETAACALGRLQRTAMCGKGCSTAWREPIRTPLHFSAISA